ncbi:MAG: ribosome silencing factor [Myxococcota bacterium]|nr:ribosome silencing factor [Myxococcales bacterium]
MNGWTAEEKARAIVDAALERKAEDPVALDVRGLTSFCDAFVIATGRSDRQVRAIADGIVQALKRAGDAPIGVEGTEEGRWVLIDANDVVCHVFDADARALYDLERLWADAREIALDLPASEARGAKVVR